MNDRFLGRWSIDASHDRINSSLQKYKDAVQDEKNVLRSRIAELELSLENALSSLAQTVAPDSSVEEGQTWAPLPNPSHMEWKALHDALHARVMLESVDDEDLCASREEVCSLLSWARNFEREAQPRRDEEEKTYSIVRRAANRIEASNAIISGDVAALDSPADGEGGAEALYRRWASARATDAPAGDRAAFLAGVNAARGAGA